MNILVLNAGSSSLKFKLIKMPQETEIVKGEVSSIGEKNSLLKINGSTIKKQFLKHEEAIKHVLKILSSYQIDIIGHRVVHGGEKFNSATKKLAQILEDIKALIPLAPLHNPSNILGIELSQIYSPHALQVAVFDTAFHSTIPSYAYTYPLPLELYKKYNIRKYGFHGTSHHFIAKQTAKYLTKPLNKLNLITIHLGNGASITAIKNGNSIDTSMGFTPLEGLMMGSRCGDIDSAILPYLQNQQNFTINDIEVLINKQSGFKGIVNTNDVREVIKLYKLNNKNAILALDMFVYRIKKYIGAYKEILNNKIDAIIFTGGIGENSPLIRKMCLNSISNTKNNLKKYIEIQKKSSNTKILVIPTNEELAIARYVINLSK